MNIRRFEEQDAKAVSELIRKTIRISNTKDYPVDLMEQLGIEIGHEITICRCGEIIPKVVKDNTTGKFVEGYWN